MRISFSSIALIGADREYTFTPGLNVIAGPIATGKTTLLRCIRGILGSGLEDFPRESKETITNLASEIRIGDQIYNVIRPFVTSQDAKVDIAGRDETERLPALKGSSPEDLTYGKWLLTKLGLPTLDVPLTPTRADSELSPVSINDFMLYCYLRQNEIDNSVYGHDNTYKNNKRKYVFEIAYGKYNIRLAQLYEDLQEVARDLTRLRSRAKTIDEFLQSTPFGNKAKIQREINDLTGELTRIEQATTAGANDAVVATETQQLRSRISDLDVRISELESSLDFEGNSQSQLQQLLSQLQTQSNRLTRSIVAGSYLLDFDFMICPRCGAALDAERTSDDVCYLCMQKPESQIGRADLINEQDRLEKQIQETRELLVTHAQSVENIQKEADRLKRTRAELSKDLDFATKSYVSDSASVIASSAGSRAELRERIKRLEDYLELFVGQEESLAEIVRLETRKRDLDANIDAITSSESGIEDRIKYLEARFQEILMAFDAPRFVESGYTGIDRSTYLPLFQGRRFDELQSQGLKVIVNVAHTLAHQLTALEYNLSLPNILLIDGITANIGYEGLDWDRVGRIFSYLVSLGETHGASLQMIVAENSVPDVANDFVRVRLSEDDKLIPADLLQHD